MIADKKKEESRERYQLSAFTVWQEGNTGQKTFKDYLIHLGIYEDKNNEFKSNEEALKHAKDILLQLYEN